MQALYEQKEYLTAQMRDNQKKILIKEGEYHSDEDHDASFLIPIASPTSQDEGQIEKQKLMMTASENIFSDTQMFVYNNVWQLNDRTTVDEINLFHKKIQYV